MALEREEVIHSRDLHSDTQQEAMRQEGENQRLAMEQQDNEAERQHQRGLAVVHSIADLHKANASNVVGIHKAQEANVAGIHKAREANAVGLQKTLHDNAHAMHLQGLAHVHEAQQSGLDRAHQLTMQKAEPKPKGETK